MRRRAALIATAATVPFVLVVTLVLVALGGGPDDAAKPEDTATVLPPVTAAAPPNASTQTANCSALLAQLPVSLGKLVPRVVHTTPDTPFVVAWGEPPVLVSCGVSRPKSLYPGSSVQLRTTGAPGAPAYAVSESGGGSVWTTVDRAPYIAITFPATVQPADYLPTLSQAIAKALPAVCSTNTADNPDTLCTRRP